MDGWFLLEADRAGGVFGGGLNGRRGVGPLAYHGVRAPRWRFWGAYVLARELGTNLGDPAAAFNQGV